MPQRQRYQTSTVLMQRVFGLDGLEIEEMEILTPPEIHRLLAAAEQPSSIGWRRKLIRVRSYEMEY